MKRGVLNEKRVTALPIVRLLRLFVAVGKNLSVSYRRKAYFIHRLHQQELLIVLVHPLAHLTALTGKHATSEELLFATLAHLTLAGGGDEGI